MLTILKIKKLNITDQELNIFSRQLILKEFSEKKFEVIQNQHITIIGMGGIGCPISQYLVSSGIKNLTLIDNDVVKVSNLNRQILYSINDVEKDKVKIAKKKLEAINPECKIEDIKKEINNDNILKYLNKSSLVIDATDNWNSMNLINKFCVNKSIPLLSTSVIGFYGQVILFKNKKNDHLCLNCIFTNKHDVDLPRCDTVGILGIAAGLTGLIGAQIIINYLLEVPETEHKLITISSNSTSIEQIKVKKHKLCVNI